jgi:hypothetical protein
MCYLVSWKEPSEEAETPTTPLRFKALLREDTLVGFPSLDHTVLTPETPTQEASKEPQSEPNKETEPGKEPTIQVEGVNGEEEAPDNTKEDKDENEDEDDRNELKKAMQEGLFRPFGGPLQKVFFSIETTFSMPSFKCNFLALQKGRSETACAAPIS